MIDLTENSIFSKSENTKINSKDRQIISWMSDGDFEQIGSENYLEENKDTIPYFKKKSETSSSYFRNLEQSVENIRIEIGSSTSTTIRRARTQMDVWSGIPTPEETQLVYQNSTTTSTRSDGFYIYWNGGEFIDNFSIKSSDEPTDIWGCKKSDKNLEECLPILNLQDTPIPWTMVEEECDIFLDSEKLPDECPWLISKYRPYRQTSLRCWSIRWPKGGNAPFSDEELALYFKYVLEGEELFDELLFDLCATGELTYYVHGGFMIDEEPLPWNPEKADERDDRNQQRTYTEKIRWEIPWMVDMLRDVWRNTISGELVNEYFLSEWYNIRNPELRKKWFSPTNDVEDGLFDRYLNMFPTDTITLTTMISSA